MTADTAGRGQLRPPRLLSGFGLLATLGALGLWLWRAGGALAAPALGRPGEWAGWVERVGAVTAAFALLRLVCLVAVGYLAVCVLVGIVAGRSRRPSVRRLADLVCLPPVRRLLEGVLGVGLGVGALTVAVAPAPPAGASPAGGGTGRAPITLTMSAIPAARPVTLTMSAVPAAAPMIMSAVPAAAPMIMRAAALPPPAPADPADPVEGVYRDDVDPEHGDSQHEQVDHIGRAIHVVEAGDHFWRIAERTVAAALGREADEAEVDAYWRRLVEANTDRLADPANPDLLFAGQVLVLPRP